MTKFEVIMPIAEKDVDTALKTIPYIKKFIKPEMITIISGETVRAVVVDEFEDSVRFIDENTMIEGLDFETIRAYLLEYNAEKRTGWYFQQFLKMGYAYIAENEYYLSWDADTVPIRDINMFCDDKPIFALKQEYNQPYFDTIKNLLGLDKQISESFIAEHMMFNKNYMRKLIDEISNVDGKWFIDILKAVPAEALSKSGFSEFETYGTYMTARYPGEYTLKNIKAVRRGKQVFGSIPSDEVLAWLSKDFSSISFEKTQSRQIENELYNNIWFRRIIPARVYVFLCKVVLKIRKE